MTKITYNSKTTEVANGKIATLSCNGKKMTTDVVIEVPEAADSPLPTEVSTEAEMTALLTSGEVGGVYKYTGTTGVYENGALYVLEESASLISFTIDGTTYQAEEGMTWGEWMESDYNTDDYQDNGYAVNKGGNGSAYVANSSGTFVIPSDTIISGHSYSMKSSGEPA